MASYNKAKSGDTTLSADTFNTVVDVAFAVNSGNSGTPDSGANNGPSRDPSRIRVVNITGTSLKALHVLYLSDRTVKPPVGSGDNGEGTDNATNDFKSRIVFNGSMPTAGTEGRWCVLEKALAPGAIGWAAVSGVCDAKVNIKGKSDKFAEIDPYTTVLKSSGTGSARILWVAGGVGSATNTGEQLATIRIDETSSGTVWINPATPRSQPGAYYGYVVTPRTDLAAADIGPSNCFNSYVGSGPNDVVLLNFNPLDNQSVHNLQAGFPVPSFFFGTTSDGKQIYGTYAFGVTTFCDNTDPEVDPDWHDIDGGD